MATPACKERVQWWRRRVDECSGGGMSREGAVVAPVRGTPRSGDVAGARREAGAAS